ncbi:MAG: hypothetical protein AAF682_30225 [Planctomycetota bacterium]
MGRRDLLKRFALLGLLTAGVGKAGPSASRTVTDNDCGKPTASCSAADGLSYARDADCLTDGKDEDCGLAQFFYGYHSDSSCTLGGSDVGCGKASDPWGHNEDNDCLPCGNDADCGKRKDGYEPAEYYTDDDGCVT